ncbi:MAG TPA: Spy/CpxP family protein refolding chaperone [Steroidobacteraceae bacterium]|nr:Spy/CpxP family protein refolding chaperone [Steroidobacteraceae bacterium]
MRFSSRFPQPVIVLIGLIAGTAALAQSPPPGPDRGPAHDFPPPPGAPGDFLGGPALLGPPPFLRDLHLTDQQEDRIFKIQYVAAPSIREQAKALRMAREALAKLGTSARYDEGSARALADSFAKAEAQLLLLHVRTEHDILAQLTPTQLEQLQKRRRAPGEGPARGGPGGGFGPPRPRGDQGPVAPPG